MKLKSHPQLLTLPQQPLPWLLFYEFSSENGIFCNIPSFPPQKLNCYRFRIQKLKGKFITACCKGWLILVDADTKRRYSLYNPVTARYIRLPPVPLKVLEDEDEKYIEDWILSSSPLHDPDSTLMMFHGYCSSILYLRLHDKKRRWKEMHYYPGSILSCPISYKGKIYAIHYKEDVGELVMLETSAFKHKCKSHSIKRDFCGLPISIYSANSVESCECNSRLITDLDCRLPDSPKSQHFYNLRYTNLVECCEDLFLIYGESKTREEGVVAFFVYKLDFSRMVWEKVESARDRVFFLCTDTIYHGGFAYSCSSENQGGSYIHYVGVARDSSNLYSYNMEDKTITLSCPGPNLSAGGVNPIWVMFENRLGDHGEDKHMTEEVEISSKNKPMVISSARADAEGDGNSSSSFEVGEKSVESMDGRSHLLDLSPHVLELIIEQCTLVDYLSFRAVSKSHRLAAPLIQWRKLRPPTSSTPLLMSLDKDKDIMTFIDPKLGDRYFLKVPELLGEAIILSCHFGWVLLLKDEISLIFYNPFTKAIVELPKVWGNFRFDFNYFLCFRLSTLPDEPTCKVIAIIKAGTRAFITSPGKSQLWVPIRIGENIQGYHAMSTPSLVFYREDMYCLRPDGKLVVFRMALRRWESLVIAAPNESDHPLRNRYLVECDNDLLLVLVSFNGQSVNILKLNHSTLKWDKMESLEKHMIYVSDHDQSSFSAIAKIPGMENKIYFPRLYEDKVVFYSLDTCKFHTFGAAKGKGNEAEALMNFYGTKVHANSCWIEPNWSS